MANEPILILAAHAAGESQLTQALSQASYEVYAADSADAFLHAVSATRFPVVIFGVERAEMSPAALAAKVIEAQPDTMTIVVGPTPTREMLSAVMRAGAADYIVESDDHSTLLQRMAACLKLRSRRRERARAWQRRAKAAEHQVTELKSLMSDRTLPAHFIEFGDYALEQFMEIERRALELERRIAAFEQPAGADDNNTIVDAWIAHFDREFSDGVRTLGPQLRMEFAAPFSTGGEILDKLSETQPSILLISDQLPDIPSELVIQTITSRYPALRTVVVRGWGTPERAVSLISGDADRPVEAPMPTVDHLIDALKEARRQCLDTSVGRQFAEKFKRRHEEFLRRLAELKAGI
ncbi:MAG: DNA-binding NtrC family response regulator [Bradymonadia bacterium]|jgi:DNA-binding NtrC family response regulator